MQSGTRLPYTDAINEDQDANFLPTDVQKGRLLLSHPSDAFTNMALDEALARTADALPTFRIYYWSSLSLSIGYFQKVVEVLNSLGSASGGLTLVRRPTGGTAVLHDNQPSFSLIIETPKDVRQVYRLLGQAVTMALQSLGMDVRLWEKGIAPIPSESTARVSPLETGTLVSSSPLSRGAGDVSHFCTSNLSPYDVLFQGKKVAGYSARRWQGHSRQGISLFQGYLHLPEAIVRKRFNVSLMVEAMIIGIEKTFRIRLEEGHLIEEETFLTQELREKKYIQRDWNYKR